jgi:hypothetical protein
LIRKDFTLTSANLPRFEQCPATGVYRLGGAEKPTHYGMWWGIFVHRFLEYAVERGRDRALEYIRTKKMRKVVALCERIDVAALPPGRAEVPLLHSPLDDTGHEGTKGDYHRDNDPNRDHFGKADFLSTSGPRPLIVDYKTGDLGDDVQPAGNTQLLGLAAALRRCITDPWAVQPPGSMWRGEVDVALVQVRATGDLDWTIATLADPDLDAYATRARLLHLRVLDDRQRADRGIPPDHATGPNCTQCELNPACPAMK